MRPVIFSFKNSKKYKETIKNNRPQISDNYKTFIKELWKIKYPKKQIPTNKQLNIIKKETGPGNWAYFPWNNTLTRIPSENHMFKLKTARNKLLISKIEQNRLRKTTAAFLGLSVGSHASITWMMQSHANNIKIADFDTLDGSNLNRIRSGWQDTGKTKTELTAQQIYQQNPYARVCLYNGVTHENIENILRDDPKVNIIIDLVDSLSMKVELRKMARKHKIPVIMATDVGNNIKIEVERYDLNKNTPLFNNQLGKIEEINLSILSRPETIKLIVKLVGLKNNSTPMLESLLGIGKKIPTWPQLGSSATIGGGVITTLITKIVQKKNVKSGVYWINLDKKLDSLYNSKEKSKKRSFLKNTAKKTLGL
ncbi:ThiF family adenylyltransferase [Patescibacteria group bacterium]